MQKRTVKWVMFIAVGFFVLIAIEFTCLSLFFDDYREYLMGKIELMENGQWAQFHQRGEGDKIFPFKFTGSLDITQFKPDALYVLEFKQPLYKKLFGLGFRETDPYISLREVNPRKFHSIFLGSHSSAGEKVLTGKILKVEYWRYYMMDTYTLWLKTEEGIISLALPDHSTYLDAARGMGKEKSIKVIEKKFFMNRYVSEIIADDEK